MFKFVSTLLLILLAGCTDSNSDALNNLSELNQHKVKHCLSRLSETDNKTPLEFCLCRLEKTGTQAYWGCLDYNQTERNKLYEQVEFCESYEYPESFKVGDIVQYYRHYRAGEWRSKVLKTELNNLWKIDDITNKHIYFQLLYDRYPKHKAGTVMEHADLEYQYYHPDSQVKDGILKSIRICKKPKPNKWWDINLNPS